MKKLIITLALIALYTHSSFSQCPINTFIEDNYMFDAKVLALRNIRNNTNDPDYNNPYLPEERVIPYLEKLSAIYENEINEEIIDSLFNELQIHVHPSYLNLVYYKRLTIGFDNSTEWLNDFINTGVSGVPALDDLMNNYSFSIFDTLIITNHTFIYLETSHDFLNILALISDFELIENIYSVDPVLGPIGGYNYVGPPYEVSEDGDLALICDIVENDSTYTFSVHGGDCPSGCIYTISWDIFVSENCEIILNSNSVKESEFVISPNPVSNILQVHLKTLEYYTLKVYSIQGKQINVFQNSPKSINVSGLNTGIYFIEIKTITESKQIKRFVKN